MYKLQKVAYSIDYFLFHWNVESKNWNIDSTLQQGAWENSFDENRWGIFKTRGDT